MHNVQDCSSRQLSLFDESTLNSLSGKTSPACSLQTKDLIFVPSSKKSCKSPFLYLNTGAMQDWLTVDAVKLHGDCSTLNTGERPSVVKESFLSLILQDDAPLKYYLSFKACMRILNQAAKAKLDLPERLRWALAETPLIKAGTLNSSQQSNEIFPRPYVPKEPTPSARTLFGYSPRWRKKD